ncbi:hypothetical protein AGMMS50212_04850 [Spirochaetia bacterium]|nr:hypothetical protein AGMMS50212_04850 [Spirochaetia bacterium]
MFFIPILIVIVVVVAASFIFFLITLNLKRGRLGGGGKIKKKNANKETLLKEAEKRLAKSPRDLEALFIKAEHHFEAGDWQKAFRAYEMITDIPDEKKILDPVTINLRAAVSALNLQMIDAAFKYIVVAHSMARNNYEVAYQFGNIEFLRNNFEKAIQYLQQSVSLNPEYAPALRILGHAYFKLKRNKEAMTYIRKAMDIAPNDKESLFTLASCYAESGQKDQALRIWSHLRPDPNWGAEACLQSGIFKIETHQDTDAIEDFSIGLKHKNIKIDVKIELCYQLGTTYLRLQNIAMALEYLVQVHLMNSEYKDTESLINKYKELNANKNLQVFIMAPSAEFVALCRKIVMTYFTKGKVKITKTVVNGNDWVDIVAEIDTPKWSDIVMFRFIRTQGVIGELVLRDFQSHLKEVKAGKGVCLGVGKYSDEAKRFTEARLIDLIDKERFIPILNNLDSASMPR